MHSQFLWRTAAVATVAPWTKGSVHATWRQCLQSQYDVDHMFSLCICQRFAGHMWPCPSSMLEISRGKRAIWAEVQACQCSNMRPLVNIGQLDGFYLRCDHAQVVPGHQNTWRGSRKYCNKGSMQSCIARVGWCWNSYLRLSRAESQLTEILHWSQTSYFYYGVMMPLVMVLRVP